MNINDTFVLETLRAQAKESPDAKVLDRREMAREIIHIAKSEGRRFEDTLDSFEDRYLSSKRFTLCEVFLNRVANPMAFLDTNRVQNIMAQASHEPHPIVIDFNKRNIGRLEKIDYTPRAVVVDGREKFAAASLRGETKVIAWVGSAVFDSVHACKMDASCPCSVKAESKTVCDIKTCPMKLIKAGKTYSLQACYKAYNSSMRGASSHRSRISAVTPPGFEETTKHMKDHPEIDNPFALSWWMYKQGYRPHAGDDKDK
jgi:hypothetical protein